MSLGVRLAVLGGLTLLPVVGMQALNQFDLRRAREAEVRASVMQQAERLAGEQARLFDGIRLVLKTLAEIDEVRSGEPAACVSTLAAVRSAHDGFEAIGVADKTGRVTCASHRTPADGELPAISDRGYFRRALEGQDFAVGTYAYGRQTRTHVIHMAHPYRDAEGQTVGVVFIALSLDWLARQLDGPAWNSDRAFSIADAGGTMLVRLPDQERFVGKPFPADLWAATHEAREPGTFDAVSPLDGVRRIVGYVPPSLGPGGLYVGVGYSRSAAFAALDAATFRDIAAAAAATLLALFFAWFVGRRLIRRPVSDLIALTERWRAGDLSVRSGARGDTEFGQLGAAFDALANDLQAALEHKDVLLRELNHRIMNSLQTIASLFKLQSRSVTDPTARRQFDVAVGRINSVALAYRRMHTAGGIETVDFTGFVRELCQDLSRSLMPDGETCRVDADPVVLVPEQAMSLALVVNELVTNAIKHGGPGSAITVKLGRSSEGCRLAVRNRGSLPPDFRADDRRGFGMQMVNAMMRQLEGRLEVSSIAGETEFAVTFVPRPPAEVELAVLASTAGTARAG
ncbi:sensor histidine kinase [Prosthecomicrobium sp. N25]|uniref:sensor histidine kinase n=1 Tax=Prosthecomicrobium sp. N25 TaxID=3129254 RepID=UPI003078414B